MFARSTALMAAPFDPHGLEITCPQLPVANSIGNFGLAGNGTLSALTGVVNHATPVLRNWIRELADRAAPTR